MIKYFTGQDLRWIDIQVILGFILCYCIGSVLFYYRPLSLIVHPWCLKNLNFMQNYCLKFWILDSLKNPYEYTNKSVFESSPGGRGSQLTEVKGTDCCITKCMAIKAQYLDWIYMVLSKNKKWESSLPFVGQPTLLLLVLTQGLGYLTYCSLNMLPHCSWKTVVISLSKRKQTVQPLTIELSAVLMVWTNWAEK